MICNPTISVREQRLSMGIRTSAPFRGMFAVRDDLLKDLRRWVQHMVSQEGGPIFCDTMCRTRCRQVFIIFAQAAILVERAPTGHKVRSTTQRRGNT